MAIDPKLVSIKQAIDLPSAIPSNAGEFLFFEDNTLQKSPMSDIYDRVNNGINGAATESTVPSATGFERWLVHEAGTYTNFSGIVVTSADLDVVNGVANNRVILEVSEGVATKRVERVKGDAGTTVLPDKYHIDKLEDGFTETGYITEPNDPTWVHTPKIELKKGAELTYTVATDSLSGNNTAALIIYDSSNNIIDRKWLSKTGALVTSKYVADADVWAVIQHRTPSAPSGYGYSVEYFPVVAGKDINKYVVGFPDFMGMFPQNETVIWAKEASISKAYIDAAGLSKGSTEIDKHTDFIGVNSGDVITGWVYVNNGSNAISFYSANNEQSYVAGVSGKTVLKEWQLVTYTAAQNGFIRLYSGDSPSFFLPNYTENPFHEKLVTEKRINAKKGVVGIDFLGEGTHFPRDLKTSGGMVSIIDDDGHLDTFNYLYPLLQSKGLPFASAICGGLIESGSFESRPIMTEQNLMTMAQDYSIVEIHSHTFSHQPLATLTPREQYKEIYQNHKWLSDRGIFPESIVVPWGSYNSETIRIMSEFYKSHFVVAQKLATFHNMRNMEISRVDFGNPGLTASQIKAMIDEAILFNRWLVICTHVSGYNDYPNWRADFESVCDYIISKGIECVKPSRGFRKMGNLKELYGVKKIGADYIEREY